jgi:hypothetical protein
MSRAWRSTGATCRVRPHRPRPAAKCCSRTGRRRQGVTGLWARAHARRLPPSERTNGWSIPVRRLAGRVLPSREGLSLVKLTLQEDRRKGRRPPANSMTDQTSPTPTPSRGTGRGGSRRTRRRCRACRRWRSLVLPRGACNRCSSEAAQPRTFTCPLSSAGAMVRPRLLWRPGVQPPPPRVHRGECRRR